MVRGRDPREPGRVGILETDGQARDGRRAGPALRSVTQASARGGATTGTRRFDGRELRAQCLDEIAVRSLLATTRSARHSRGRQALRTATGTCWACRSSRIRSSATASFWGS